MRVLLRLLVLTALASTAPAAAAQAKAAAVLSPVRFAALDAIYVASLPLDRNPTPAQVAELRRVCEAVDRGDRLLAVERTSCLTGVDAIGPSQAFARCSARRACVRAAWALRIVLRRSLSDARAANGIVALELAPGACRTELRSNRALLRSLEALGDGLAMLERALRRNDRAAIRRAERRIAAAGDALDDQPTAAQSLEVFRGVCAPAAPR